MHRTPSAEANFKITSSASPIVAPPVAVMFHNWWSSMLCGRACFVDHSPLAVWFEWNLTNSGCNSLPDTAHLALKGESYPAFFSTSDTSSPTVLLRTSYQLPLGSARVHMRLSQQRVCQWFAARYAETCSKSSFWQQIKLLAANEKKYKNSQSYFRKTAFFFWRQKSSKKNGWRQITFCRKRRFQHIWQQITDTPSESVHSG